MFKPYEVVHLNSSDIKMTVIESTDYHAKCTWLDKNGDLQEATFPVETLNKVISGSGMLVRRTRK